MSGSGSVADGAALARAAEKVKVEIPRIATENSGRSKRRMDPPGFSYIGHAQSRNSLDSRRPVTTGEKWTKVRRSAARGGPDANRPGPTGPDSQQRQCATPRGGAAGSLGS